MLTLDENATCLDAFKNIKSKSSVQICNNNVIEEIKFPVNRKLNNIVIERCNNVKTIDLSNITCKRLILTSLPREINLILHSDYIEIVTCKNANIASVNENAHVGILTFEDDVSLKIMQTFADVKINIRTVFKNCEIDMGVCSILTKCRELKFNNCDIGHFDSIKNLKKCVKSIVMKKCSTYDQLTMDWLINTNIEELSVYDDLGYPIIINNINKTKLRIIHLTNPEFKNTDTNVFENSNVTTVEFNYEYDKDITVVNPTDILKNLNTTSVTMLRIMSKKCNLYIDTEDFTQQNLCNLKHLELSCVSSHTELEIKNLNISCGFTFNFLNNVRLFITDCDFGINYVDVRKCYSTYLTNFKCYNFRTTDSKSVTLFENSIVETVECNERNVIINRDCEIKNLWLYKNKNVDRDVIEQCVNDNINFSITTENIWYTPSRIKFERVAKKSRKFVEIDDADLRCSICTFAYEDPVITDTGGVYCEECITEWFKTNSTDPLTNVVVSKKLIPCATIKSIVEKKLKISNGC